MTGAPAPLEGRERALGTFAVSLTTFMTVLDHSIANVSIPAIAGDMSISPTQGAWVITSFGIANAIAVPLTGWLTKRMGQVRVFAVSMLLFILASWLCGLASSIETLIALRVLQGAAAGPLVPLAQTLLLASYPPALAGTAMAFWSMTTLAAPVLGPVLGGWITDNLSWPWIFYINIPIGVLSLALTWSIYRRRNVGREAVPADRVGIALLVVWVASMQMALDLGKDLDWFASPLIVALAVTAAIGFIYFLVWELTHEAPLVNLRLFARPGFLLGVCALSLGYGLFFSNIVLLPLWLQQWMGYTATWAGLVAAPTGLLAMVLVPWVGQRVARVNPRVLSSVAFLGFAVVFWMRSRFNVEAPLEVIVLPMVLQGIAQAFFFVPLQAITFQGLAAREMAGAAGLSNFVRICAGAICTSLMLSLWESRARLHHAHLVETLHREGAATALTLQQFVESGLDDTAARAALDRLVEQQAWTLGVTDLFYLSACASLLLLGLMALSLARWGPPGNSLDSAPR